MLLHSPMLCVVPSIVPTSSKAHCSTDYRLKDHFSTTLPWHCLVHYFELGLCSYATRTFLCGGIRELGPIEVDLFRPNYIVDIVPHTVAGVLFLDPTMSLGVIEKPISAEREAPSLSTFRIQKTCTAPVCNIRTEQTDRPWHIESQQTVIRHILDIGPKNRTLCSSESDGDSPLTFGGIIQQNAIHQRPQHVAPRTRIKSDFHIERDEEDHAAQPVVVVIRPQHCLHYLLDGVDGRVTGSETVHDRLGRFDTFPSVSSIHKRQ
ncbi:hypothetical protein J6590_000068 [Homalodisca vitripennis]|nr:hypothetical protein J6590_000068 [Homalodisca vitripennis]